MRVFVSHAAEEAHVAAELRRHLEAAVPGVDAFVSSEGIEAGERWLAALEGQIKDAAMMIILCSRRSIDRPWVNFEGGAGFGRAVKVVPLCHGGLRGSELPFPLKMFEYIDVAVRGDIDKLLRMVARRAGVDVVADVDVDAVVASLAPEPPVRGQDIGVVLAYGQDGWDRWGVSIFDLPQSIAPSDENRWTFRRIERTDDLFMVDLNELSGIVLGAPWHSRMPSRAVDAVVDWVTAGGRLLLLGFEYGDRHHEGNMNEVASRFGIQFSTDIVGPPGTSKTKPYNKEVQIDPACAEPHDLTANLGPVVLTNVQTLRVEPGAKSWLRVGDNIVCVPKADTVRYDDGMLSQAGSNAVECSDQSRLPVAAEVHHQMTGRGAVQAIGTWQLLGPKGRLSANVNNAKLLERLLDWLARTEPSKVA